MTLATLLSLIGVGISMAPAGAAACSGSHCYATTRFEQVNIGGSAQLYIKDMSVVGSLSSSFVTQEVWVGTSNSANRWVEAGYVAGKGQQAERWFWAAQTSTGYSEHYPNQTQPPSYYGQYKQITIELDTWTGNPDRWAVYINGTTHYATNSPCCSTRLTAGSESTDTGNYNPYANAAGSLMWRNVFNWANNWAWNGIIPYSIIVGSTSQLNWYLQWNFFFDGIN